MRKNRKRSKIIGNGSKGLAERRLEAVRYAKQDAILDPESSKVGFNKRLPPKANNQTKGVLE